MNHKGGRGKKAPYKTTHTRVPENIKSIVDNLSDSYKAYVDESKCLDFDDKNLLPFAPAVYFVIEQEEIIYIGQTVNLKQRWNSHHLLSEIKELNKLNSIKIAWLNCNDIDLLKSLEKLLIDTLEPRLNRHHLSLAALTPYKPKWRSGKTQTIRVPIAITDWVLQAARWIDENDRVSLLHVVEELEEKNRELLAENNRLTTIISKQVIGDRNESNKISSTQAWECAKASGYPFSVHTFKNNFTKNRKDKNYTFQGFKRVKNLEGQGYLYQLVEDSHE